MNRLTGLILATVVGASMSACASAGTTGGASASAQAEQQGTKPSDNKYTRDASRAIGLALLKKEAAEKRELYQQALAAARQAIADEPGNPMGYYLAGQAFANLGEVDSADVAFDRAQEIYPAYEQEIDQDREAAWVTAYNAGISAYQGNDMAGAIAEMEKADRIYQGRPEARMNLGVFYSQQDQQEKAIVAYRGALEILRGTAPAGLDEAGKKEWRENEEVATLHLAQLLSAAGREAEAEQEYRDFLARNPDHLEARIRLGGALAKQGKADEANQIYTELLSRTDLTDGDYLQIGVELFRAEQFEGAANAFRKTVEKNPYSRDGHYNLAQALFVRAGKLDEKKKAAKGEAVKQLNAELAAIHEELAGSAEKVLGLDPFNRNILAYIARAYQALSQLAPDAKTRSAFQKKVQGVSDRYESFAFEVNDISIRPGENGVRITGSVKNFKLKAGQPVKLRFSLLTETGQPIGAQVVTVSAPAPEQATVFEVAVPATGAMAGWKYEQVN